MKKILFPLFAAVILLLAGCGKKTAQPLRHQLTLNADQPGATAYIFGKSFALPHEFKMTSGNYLFRIEKPGFAPAWFSCRVLASGIQTARDGADGEVQWEAFREKKHTVRLRPQGGSVLIMSKPEAAEVIMDNRVIGSTPLVLTDQPVGRHTAQLRSPNHSEISLFWEIKDARPVIIRADLKSNIGELRLNSTPEKARVFIDDRPAGFTPYRGPQPAGKHLVRLERDGFLPVQSHITVELGQTVSENYTLIASPGSLEVESSPSNAQVSLNGQVRGTTPLKLKDLPAGKYEIRVELPGYDRAEESVEIAAGSLVTRSYDLATSQGGMELNVYPAGVTVYMDGKEVGKVEPGEGKTQTKLIRLGNLSPGTYTIKAMHKRANPNTEIRRVKVVKGQIARPKRIELWVPNAEITWLDNGRSELVMIYGETDTVILYGPAKGIRVEIPKSNLKNIKWLDINE